jgi:hypothetical protein
MNRLTILSDDGRDRLGMIDLDGDCYVGRVNETGMVVFDHLHDEDVKALAAKEVVVFVLEAPGATETLS